MDSDFLPIGTIVRLKQYENANDQNDFLHMIIGYGGENQNHNKQSKYTCVLYPYGLVGENLLLIDDIDIYSIIYYGYDISEINKN